MKVYCKIRVRYNCVAVFASKLCSFNHYAYELYTIQFDLHVYTPLIKHLMPAKPFLPR
jgi:hypothetical protein